MIDHDPDEKAPLADQPSSIDESDSASEEAEATLDELVTPAYIEDDEPIVANVDELPEQTLDEVEAVPIPLPEPENNKKWFVVKVQSGREESIRAAIERKVRIEGLENYYGQIAIPVERYEELNKKNKRVIKERKKFHGYFLAEVEYNDQIVSLFRETSGVGDFVGATQHRAPPPLTALEVEKMLDDGMTPKPDQQGKGGETATVAKPAKLPNPGDHVRVRDGMFANMEGEVKRVIEPKDSKDSYKLEVELTIFGRPVPVEVDFWHVDTM